MTGGDFKDLHKFAAVPGAAFLPGLVLYGGEQAVPFGERLPAAPLSCPRAAGR